MHQSHDLCCFHLKSYSLWDLNQSVTLVGVIASWQQGQANRFNHLDTVQGWYIDYLIDTPISTDRPGMLVTDYHYQLQQLEVNNFSSEYVFISV